MNKAPMAAHFAASARRRPRAPVAGDCRGHRCGYRHHRQNLLGASRDAQGNVSESRRPGAILAQALENNRMSSDLIKHVTDDSFSSDVLEADVPVLVDYWAEWCGPCKMIAPILDELSKDYDGRLQIAKMNVDDNRAVPEKFGIRGIPTLMIFKGGQKVGELVGARPKRELTAFVDGHL
jgi:thioredoxin 1